MPKQATLLNRIPPSVIDGLWAGSIDMHIHPGPDPDAERPLDSLQMALLAQRAGMRGIVLKRFLYPTSIEAAIIQKNAAAEIAVLGSVVISEAIGGLENAARVIEDNARMGCKVVWFPAMDAKHCREYLAKPGGIRILDGEGKMKSQVWEILEVIKARELVVCSGHMSYEETSALFDAAKDLGIAKMVATHPLAGLSRFSMEQILALADKGAFIEHVYGSLMPRLGSIDPAIYVECVKKVGAPRCIMSSDLAQVWDPAPADGMRHYIAMMLQFGCTPGEVEYMVKTNPSWLLDL